jgi:hypothetical protein
VHLRRYHLMRRLNQTEVRELSQVYPRLAEGALLDGSAGERMNELWRVAGQRLARS